MKKFTVLFLFSLLCVSAASASKIEGPLRMVYPPSTTFLPLGFDDNDNSQIIVYGEFPNTCYRIGPIQATVNESRNEIRIVNEAYYYPSSWCHEIAVPFTQVVNVGVLSKGDYKVMIQNQDATIRMDGLLNIAHTDSPLPDNFTYAPVQDAFMETNAAGNLTTTLVLRGNFTNSCMFIKDVMFPAQTQGSDVVVVLPIMDMKSEACLPKITPFEVKKALPQNLKGKVLLHVRTLNGGSLNQVLDL